MQYAFKVQIKVTPPDLVERLRNAPREVPRAVAREIDKQNQITVGHIIEKRMTGKGPFPASEGRLGVRSARMRRSLRASRASVTPKGILSAIGSNLTYMGIHEFGGQTKPHLIKARRKQSLRFILGGKTILRRSVQHPGSKIPPRQPIYRGIVDRVGAYGRAVTGAVLQALGGQNASGGAA